MGGAGISDTAVQIVLRGNADQTVVIAGMRVVTECTSPLTGTLLYSPPAGASTNVDVGFNLDAQFPIAQDARNAALSGNYFAEHTISLRRGETQTLLVHAITRRQFCHFTYQLIVDNGSKQVSEPISDHGKPFVVTAPLIQFHSNGSASFTSYRTLYVGGVANPANDGYVPADPNTYNGLGSP